MAPENTQSAGGLLRQGRLKQRLSIAECAKRTHIATRYLEALEEEQWSILPSESHRLGFLKLYSRFLGVPVDEVINLYKKKAPSPASEEPDASDSNARYPGRAKSAPRNAAWSPSSIPQVIGIAITILLFSWLIYHAVIPRVFEQNPMPWTRRRSLNQARLVVPKAVTVSHKIRLKAAADSWLRVTSKDQLLFEGILKSGAVKEWSGSGPFQLKVGNVHALSLFWNDQPVDVLSGARGDINEIRIPPQ